MKDHEREKRTKSLNRMRQSKVSVRRDSLPSYSVPRVSVHGIPYFIFCEMHEMKRGGK